MIDLGLAAAFARAREQVEAIFDEIIDAAQGALQGLLASSREVGKGESPRLSRSLS